MLFCKAEERTAGLVAEVQVAAHINMYISQSYHQLGRLQRTRPEANALCATNTTSVWIITGEEGRLQIARLPNTIRELEDRHPGRVSILCRTRNLEQFQFDQ